MHDDATLHVLGAYAGMPLALLVQAVNAGLLRARRRSRPALSEQEMRALLVPVPTVAALAVPAALVLLDSPPASIFASVIPAALTAAIAWTAAAWCLAPFRSQAPR